MTIEEIKEYLPHRYPFLLIDRVDEYEKDKRLIATKSEPPERRNPQVEKDLADRLSAIDIRFAEIDRQLAQDFPDYSALASPAPVTVKEVQAQLGTDEALVLFLDTTEWKPLPEETFVWVVTKTDMRWVRSNLGTAARIRGGLERATTFVTLINAPIRLFAYLVGADCNRCRTLRRRPDDQRAVLLRTYGSPALRRSYLRFLVEPQTDPLPDDCTVPPT